MSVALVETRAADAFGKQFGGKAATVSVAPGRINVVGEHTDYNDGFVLPAAIDRQVGVALRLRADGRVVLRSDRFDDAVELDGIPSKRQGNWADYALGVAHELREQTGRSSGFDASIVSDIPVGSGLSSSGALEVAVAVALLDGQNVQLEPLTIARLCQRAENRFVGARTGIMDQFTALRARAGNAMLLDCRSFDFEDVPLELGRYGWLLADTRVHHALASSAYNERRQQCEAAAAAMGVSSLRDATETDLARLDDPLLQRRARHVVTENSRVHQAADALRRRAMEELGAILSASHASLRDDFAVSCAELDRLVDVAASKPSVLGARMMGGGFGGCVLLLVDSSRMEEVERDLAEGYRRSFQQLPAFYRVHSVNGAMPSRR